MDAISLHSTTAFLGGVTLMQAIASLTAGAAGDRTVASSNAIGAAVCLIARQIYAKMQGGADDGDSALRYADWLITCPLMLIEFFILFGIDVRSNSASLSLAILLITVCILLGRRAVVHARTRVRDFTLACACFVAMLVVVARAIPDWSADIAMPLAFLSVWLLYPIAFWAKRPAAFNALDFVAKGVFGLFTAAKAIA